VRRLVLLAVWGIGLEGTAASLDRLCSVLDPTDSATRLAWRT